MKKVLIIDDDRITARIHRAVLEKEGYEVEVAADGKAGVQRLIELRPDALLLDLMLPEIGGIELLKSLRQWDFFQGLWIVVSTNAFVPQVIQAARQAGATMVFDKHTLTPLMLAEAFWPIKQAS